jgi:hypothetical protein
MQTLKGCSAPTARKEIKRVREILGLSDNEPLMLRQLAAVWDCPVKDLAEALYSKPKKLAA